MWERSRGWCGAGEGGCWFAWAGELQAGHHGCSASTAGSLWQQPGRKPTGTFVTPLLRASARQAAGVPKTSSPVALV